MKVRDSGMPEETLWESLFDVVGILDAFQIGTDINDAVEVGCGYGTFSIPIAQRIGGRLIAYDLDPQMIATTKRRVQEVGLSNLEVKYLDVEENGFDIPSQSLDAVFLFNILHGEHPVHFLKHSEHALKPSGSVYVIHWRFDENTPRGPDLSIRPRPEELVDVAHRLTGLRMDGLVLDLPPWHYGLKLVNKPGAML